MNHDQRVSTEMSIRRLQGPAEAEACARMMCSTEPWLTIGRAYDECHAGITDPARDVYVAVHDNDIAGFIVVVLQGAFIGYIQAICVAPAARAQGIGTRLIDFAEARIGQVSPNVFLCVSDFNPRARALYERRGYQLVGELKDYLIRGHSELLMRKTTGPLREYTGQRASGTGKGHVS